MEDHKPLLLIVDDDEEIRTQMKWALAQEYKILLAEDRKSALSAMRRERPSVVTLDLGLPPFPSDVQEGFGALEEMVECDPYAKIVVITGQDDRKHALKAVESGAYDFFSKPIEFEPLKVVLRRALYLNQLEKENLRLHHLELDTFEGMLGTSRLMQEVFAVVRKVATTDAPVLVVGESGTGKELTARAIHQRSRRKNGPFIAINCSAIPENLLESELFGHERGAFTGAHIQRPGQFEMAQGGTLFLDEIGELSPPLQVKLLRFLQDGQIQRVGGRKEISIDARIIAATNSDLQKALQESHFREDLYYRLAVVVICMPPLREREGDLLLLATYFLQRYVHENRKKITGFAPEAAQAIETYSWHGNVRELENRVRRAVIMAESTKVTLANLGLAASYSKYEGKGLREAREALERELVERALTRNQGNITRAAEDLDVSRPTFYELMEKLQINR